MCRHSQAFTPRCFISHTRSFISPKVERHLEAERRQVFFRLVADLAYPIHGRGSPSRCLGERRIPADLARCPHYDIFCVPDPLCGARARSRAATAPLCDEAALRVDDANSDALEGLVPSAQHVHGTALRDLRVQRVPAAHRPECEHGSSRVKKREWPHNDS